jgi:hypothetical protein
MKIGFVEGKIGTGNPQRKPWLTENPHIFHGKNPWVSG